MNTQTKTYYEEKEFPEGLFFRIHPGGAWAPKHTPKKSITNYPIDHLLNRVQNMCGFRTRDMTCSYFGIDSSLLTRIRKGRAILGPRYILLIHDRTGLSISEIRRIGEIPHLADPIEILPPV